MEQSLHDGRHRDCTLEKEDMLLYLSNQPVARIFLRNDSHTSPKNTQVWKKLTQPQSNKNCWGYKVGEPALPEGCLNSSLKVP